MEQDDLFEKLQESATAYNVTLPATVKAIMDTWTMQSGYPLVRVDRINPNEVKFSQVIKIDLFFRTCNNNR